MKHFHIEAFRKGMVLLFMLITSSLLMAQNFPAGFQTVRIAKDLNPTDMKFSPDGQYLFVCDKSGRLYLSKNDEWRPSPILDFTTMVDSYNERGFEHIAVDPDFATNGYIYVYYTVMDVAYNRIARFTFNFTTELVDPASHLVLLDLQPMTGTIHAGGALNFGPDGKLYITTGESANPFLAQNTSSLLGKVLRINKDGSIPTDNPFYNTLTGVYRSIYALGLRNPFYADIQPGTGRFFACDVGESTYEEINEILPGKNYGWNFIEGPKPPATTAPPDYVEPKLYYHHSEGCAVVGGVFYNPVTAMFPAEYVGKFFYMDYCSGWIKTMDPATGAVHNTFATGIGAPICQAVSPGGALYYLDRGGSDGAVEHVTSVETGVLWKVVYTGELAPNIAVHPDTVIVTAGSNVTFSAVANGLNLSWQWIRNGVDMDGKTQKTLTLTNVQLADSGTRFSVRVTNPNGTVTSREGLLKVTNRPLPEPVISLPAEGFTYKANTTLNFAGSATDAVEGPLPESKLTWKIDFHHDDHHHPVLAPTQGISSGSIFISPVNEVSPHVWFRIYLTAENELGLSNTIYRDVQPKKITFTTKAPAGVPINVSGTNIISPGSFESVVGVDRALRAAFAPTIADTLFYFQRWGDGVTTPERTIRTPENDATIEVIYIKKAVWNGSGLKGEYFNQAYTANFSGTPVLTRTDPVINFDWGTGSPGGSVRTDQFSVRWTGFVQPRATGLYTFYVNSNDGVRLYVNNQLIIDRWAPQATTESTGTIQLDGANKYPIRLEYFDDADAALAQLRWSATGTPGVPKDIIPTNSLFTGSEAPLPVNFIEFSVRPQEKALQLNWKVEDLGNVKEYTVERRAMNSGFETIATIPSTGSETFAYTDKSVDINTMYQYRIKETDYDGKFVYSPLRTGMLSSNTGLDFEIIPNPAVVNMQVQLVFTQEMRAATVQLLTVSGHIVADRPVTATAGQSIELPLQGLAAGTYYIKLINNDKVVTKKLLIQ